MSWTDTTYVLDGTSGSWFGGQSVGGTSKGEAPLGSWADPAALADLQNTAAAGMLVLKGHIR